MGRSIFAVVVGYLAMAAAVIITDIAVGALVPRAFADPQTVPTGYLAFNLFTSACFGVLGGYVAARLAQRREIVHALALGLLAEAIAVAGLVQAMGTSRMWYSLALLGIVLPSALLGGWLRARQVEARRGSETVPA